MILLYIVRLSIISCLGSRKEDGALDYFDFRYCPGPTSQVKCPRVTVSGAKYENMDGVYRLIKRRHRWSPQRPFYKHVSSSR